MKLIRICCFWLAFVAGVLDACAVSPYPELEVKAGRFFQQKEWASAAALYDLMLDERPDVAWTYGRAIVVNAMCGDSVAEMRLMAKALDNHVPFDSVFSRVRSTCFEIGNTRLYEEFLIDVKGAYTWMRRTVDAYLLRYYVFRRNGRKMVEYSGIMLDGAADNTGFLASLADGYMICGEFEKGIDIYRRILSVECDNYDALLNLGNYYFMEYAESGSATAHDEAVAYLSRAEAVRQTPFVAKLLEELKR